MFKTVMIIAFIGVAILLSPAGDILADNPGGGDFDLANLETMNEVVSWFETNNNICFGYTWRNHPLVCTPSYLVDKNRVESRLPGFSKCDLVYTGEDCQFWALRKPAISGNFARVPGDTVLLVWGEGQAKTTIKHIGYYNSTCTNEILCYLELTDTTVAPPTGRFIALMGDLAHYSGPIIPYSEYKPDDSRLNAIADSLKDVLNDSYKSNIRPKIKGQHPGIDSSQLEELVEARWQEMESGYGNRELVNTQFYGVSRDELPDTLFLFTSSWYGSTECGWSAAYRLINNDGIWQIENMKKPGLGGASPRIICALDLNGDGGGIIDLSIIIDGVFESVKSGGYWGC